MSTAAASMAHQMLSNSRVSATVTRTAAVVSASTRMKMTALVWASGSTAMRRRDTALRPSEPSSARSAREVTPRAASRATIRKPNPSRRAAPTSRSAPVMCEADDVRPRGSS